MNKSCSCSCGAGGFVKLKACAFLLAAVGLTYAAETDQPTQIQSSGAGSVQQQSVDPGSVPLMPDTARAQRSRDAKNSISSVKSAAPLAAPLFPAEGLRNAFGTNPACTPDAGDCCTDTGTPGCDNIPCCDAVCLCDPFCCDTVWDGFCAGPNGTVPGCSAIELCQPQGLITCTCQDSAECTDPLEPNCCDAPDGSCNECCVDADCPVGLICGSGTCITPLECPPGALLENEPDCGLPDDTVNGGCNVDPPLFLDISCGDTYCGSGVLFNDPVMGLLRDTDWYQLVILDQTTITMTVSAEFDLIAGVVNTGGSGDCLDATAVDPLVVVAAGATEMLSVTLDPGTWWLFVGADFDGITFDCGLDYVLSLTCAVPMGSCCVDGICAGELPQNECLASGGGGGGDNPCAPDLNGDCLVNASDLAQLLGAWGPCPMPCTPGQCEPTCPADLNNDCVVNASDLAQLLGAWGPCGPDCTIGHEPCPQGGGCVIWTPDTSCTNPDLPSPICQVGCSWDNGPPLDDFGVPASQYAPDFPFAAETGDDFILCDDTGPNPCLITEVLFWATYFGNAAPGDPATQWNGVQITIYSDATPKSPGGQREDDGSFTDLIPGGLVATQFVPIGNLTIAPFPTMVIDEVFQVSVPLNLVLDKNIKYWLVIQPEMDFAFGQLAILLSQNKTWHRAQQCFPAAAIDAWTEVAGDATTGQLTDMSFLLTGVKVGEQIGACCDQGTGICEDDILLANCIDPNDRFAEEPVTCATLMPPCEPIPGACCFPSFPEVGSPCFDDCCVLTQPECLAAGGTFSGTGTNCTTAQCVPEDCTPDAGPCNVAHLGSGCNIEECCDAVCDINDLCCDDSFGEWDEECVNTAASLAPICPIPPCNLVVPPGAIEEQELCGDDTNGGCNSDPAAFESVSCGDIIHGTIEATGGGRDTDWFLVTVPENPPGSGLASLTASLTSQFPGVSFIIEGPPTDCVNLTTPGTTGCSENCVPIQPATSFLTAPGEYVVFVSAGDCEGAGVFEGFPCGNTNEYVLEITCGPGPVCGDGTCDSPFETCANDPPSLPTECLADCGPCATGCGTVQFTQSLNNQVIEQFNSVSCNTGAPDFLHVDNGYFRSFNLADFGIVGNFNVCGVDIGIESADAGDFTSQPVDLILYDTLISAGALGTPIGQETFAVPHATALVVEQFVYTGGGFTTTTGNLTVELFTPDGTIDGNSFFIGSNTLGQTGPSYLEAAGCGVFSPTPTGDIGFPDMHIVMTVRGDLVP